MLEKLLGDVAAAKVGVDLEPLTGEASGEAGEVLLGLVKLVGHVRHGSGGLEGMRRHAHNADEVQSGLEAARKLDGVGKSTLGEVGTIDWNEDSFVHVRQPPSPIAEPAQGVLTLSRKTARAANRKGRVPAAYFAGEVTTLAKTPVVDADTCTGCGLCEQIGPETFRLNDDGIAEIVDPAGNDEETIQECIDSCPVEAISWGA